jgi:alanine racemase
LKTHIEINAAHLVHNLNEFSTLTGGKIMFAVKANAYGHGLKEIVSIAKDLSYIHYYAVDSVEEALIVKAVDHRKKILVIGWADSGQLREIIANDFEMVVPSIDYLKQVKALACQLEKPASVHLKVETGTSRLGMPPAAVVSILDGSAGFSPNHVRVTGIYSHFANIEDTTDHSYALRQLDIFNRLLEKIDHKNLLKHFSCSASTLLFPKTYFDIVRIGISAYGFWPSRATYISCLEQNKRKPLELKPVLSWYSKVAQVKDLGKNKPIGYGLTYKTFDRSRIIVVPVGYYDGYDRKLSNAATIIVNGFKAPVRGRICMNMLMAEVTHIKKPPVKAGDLVTLIGQGNGEKITADDLAELAGSINYEVVSRINPLIPRVVI